MQEIRDFMFGDNILPEKRLEAHRLSLSGIQHRAAADPPRPRSGEAIQLHVITSGSLPFERVRVFYTLDGAAPAQGRAQTLDLQAGPVTWDNVDWLYIRHWQGALPGQPDDTLVRYRIGAQVAGSQRWVFADNQVRTLDSAHDFAIWVSDLPAPAWAQQALVYHVFVDRFYPGDGKPWKTPDWLDGFYGGTLGGVIDKLDYIHGLGYNTIWLSPIFPSPSHHGYDATDMYHVEPRLGSNEDFDRLIAAAQRREMRLILDFVANHWSNLHPSMLAAQKDRKSQYYHWYHWKKWPDEYDGFFGVKSMPKLNLTLGSPARQHLLECARYWLEKGIDGYRLDYAYGPPLDFWVDFRRVCKQTKPDSWLFGEVIMSAPVQKAFAGSFDGMIDFLLAEALRQTFGYEQWSLAQFDAYLNGHEGYFDGLFDRLTILDNHDMNRFLFLAGDDTRRLKLGALALYTLAGNPINYYGTESGVTQELPTHHDDRGFFEEARQPMRWGADVDEDLLDYFRRLLALRAAHPALSSGSRRTLHLNDEKQTYAYLRESPAERLLVALNQSETPQLLTITVSGLADVSDLLNDVSVSSSSDALNFVLPPKSGALFGKR
jgi:glycosidase